MPSPHSPGGVGAAELPGAAGAAEGGAAGAGGALLAALGGDEGAGRETEVAGVAASSRRSWQPRRSNDSEIQRR
jgi:hypothetical protein